MSRRRLRCLLGHSWTYLVAPPTIAGWCTRCNIAAEVPTTPVGVRTEPYAADSRGITASASSTFQLLAQAIAGHPVDPAHADPATLVKAAALLTFMHAPANPLAVLDIVRERLVAAEDTAAIAHLDPDRRPR